MFLLAPVPTLISSTGWPVFTFTLLALCESPNCCRGRWRCLFSSHKALCSLWSEHNHTPIPENITVTCCLLWRDAYMHNISEQLQHVQKLHLLWKRPLYIFYTLEEKRINRWNQFHLKKSFLWGDVWAANWSLNSLKPDGRTEKQPWNIMSPSTATAEV